MRISETLDSGVPWHWIMLDRNQGYAAFTTLRDTEYKVMIAAVSEPNSYFIGFDVENSIDGHMTANFEALSVLSTVIDIMESFVRTGRKVDEVNFYSRIEEQSRLRTYRALIKRFARLHGFIYAESEEEYLNLNVIKFLIYRVIEQSQAA